MEVHVPVDIRDGTEIFLTVETAEGRSTICQYNWSACILSLDWSSNNIQP
jgi:hypothetical protein